MRFTNFGSVVKTYKKNFLIRKGKFIAERKAIQAKKKKDREDRIETVKAVQPLIKLKGRTSKKSNFLDNIKDFLGLMLAGFILKNLKTIIPLLSEAFKKIKEITSGIGEFVSGVIGGLKSFYEASTEKIAELNQYIKDFNGIDISEFGKFETEAGKLGKGVLELARLLTSAELIKDLLGFGKARGGSGTGGTGPMGKKPTPPARRAPVRTPALVRTPAPVRTPVRIPTPARIPTRTPTPTSVRTPASTPVATPTPKPTAVPAQPRVPVGAGTGGKGKPFGDLISRTGKPGDMSLDAQKRMQNLSDLTDRSLKAIADDLNGITSSNPTTQEKYIRKLQDKGIRVSDELVGAAGDAAAIRSGALPSERLVGYTKKFNSAMAAETRMKADLRSQGIEIDNEGEKLVKEMMEEYSEGLRRQRLERFLGGSTTSTRTGGQRLESLRSNLKGQQFQAPSVPRQIATVRMMSKIIRFLRYLGITLGIVSLVLLAKEIGEDYERGDMKAVIVKLTAAGFGAAASALAFTAGVAVAGTGVGIVKGGLIIAGSAGIGIGVEEGIRRGFLGSPGQSAENVKPSISKLPPLPPTGTLGTGAQAYGASRDGGKRKHAGVDFDPADDKNSKFYSRIGGEVIFAGNVGGGYGNVVDIYNAELGFTERIAEGDKIHVKVGDVVKRGTLVQSGSTMTGVFHYEIRKGKAGHSGAFEGTIDPLYFLKYINANQNQASIKTSPSSLISNAGLNQSTTYSDAGMSVRREVNNIFIPINA